MPIWEGSWQGHWAGRTQAQLTRIAEQSASDADLEAEVTRFAREHGQPPEPMLDYTKQWRTIRLIWTTPTDPEERVRARILGDQEYLRVGLANISADPAGYVRRRLTRGLFVLWAADVPIRFTRDRRHSDLDHPRVLGRSSAARLARAVRRLLPLASAAAPSARC